MGETPFANVDKELDELQARFQSLLYPEVYEYILNEFVHPLLAKNMAALNSLLTAHDDLRQPPPEDYKDKKAMQEYMSRQAVYIKRANPKKLADELRASTSDIPDRTWSVYQKDLIKIMEMFPEPAMVQRYAMPERVVKGLAAAAMEELAVIGSWIAELGTRYVNRAEAVKEAMAKKDSHQGAQAAASVAGSIVGGRGGGMLARGLVELFWDPRKPIDEAEKSIKEAHVGFCDYLNYGIAHTRNCLTLLALTLYGGLFARIEEDLQGIGRSLWEVSKENGEYHFCVSEAVFAAVSTWAADTEKHIQELRDRTAWNQVLRASERALKSLTSDPFRAQVYLDNADHAYSMRLARHRAESIYQLAEEEWQAGHLEEAGTLYLRLLEGTQLAWDEHLKWHPQQAYLAGWRLASLATYDDKTIASTMGPHLGCLCRYVVQVQARFCSEDYLLNCLDEHISPGTFNTAVAISRYAAFQGIDVNLQTRIPDRIREKLKPDFPESCFGGSFDPEFVSQIVHDETGDPPTSSDIDRWIYSLASRIQKKRARRNIVIAALVLIALIAGFTWFFASPSDEDPEKESPPVPAVRYEPAGQESQVSPPLQKPSPDTTGQSTTQVSQVSTPSQKPSPHTGRQSAPRSVEEEQYTQEVERYIQSKLKQVRLCYQQAVQSNPNLAGQVVYQWVITPTGKAVSVKVTSTTLNSKAVEQCIKSRISKWRFPSPRGGGTFTVKYPFIFQVTE